MTSSICDYLENKLIDHVFRSSSYTKPTNLYLGLILADGGYWQATTAYTTEYVIPSTPNGRLYKCTTGGTSGGSEPTWPTTPGGTVVDGTVTWTEQSDALDAGTIPEPSGGAYARVANNPADTNWDSTQGGTTGDSSGTDGQTHNVADATFPAPSGANWGLIFGTFINDAATSGNDLFWSSLDTPKQINDGDPAPKFPANGLTVTLGAQT